MNAYQVSQFQLVTRTTNYYLSGITAQRRNKKHGRIVVNMLKLLAIDNKISIVAFDSADTIPLLSDMEASTGLTLPSLFT